MSMHRPLRHWIIALAFFLGGSAASVRAAGDPVEDLRQALKLEDVRLPNDNIIEFREKNLDEKINNLKTISDLRRAFLLDEWKEEPGQGRNEKLRQIDENKRAEVGKRLQKRIQAAAASPDPNVRLAVANLVAEMGPMVRSYDLKDRHGFTRTLTKEMIQLAQDPDLGVRQEGLRAVSTINPDLTVMDKAPPPATEVFRKTIQSKDQAGPRRVAASGLAQLLRVVNQLKKLGRGSSRNLVTEAELKAEIQNASIEVTKVARLGLTDADPLVKMYCLDAIQLASNTLLELTTEPYLRKDFPPEGRPLTEEEKREIVKNYEVVRKEFEVIAPLAKILSEQSSLLADTLAEPDPRVRATALRTLDYLASARLKMKRRQESVPFVSDKKVDVDPIVWQDPLAGFFQKGFPSAVRLLGDADVQIRRNAVVFLELLEKKAIDAIPALANSLADPDRFVRWSAARAIGSIAPKQSQVAVPNLGKLLTDPDLNLRHAAASALDQMGLSARGAARDVANALREGDAESRLIFMTLLAGLDPNESQIAIPLLIDNLSSPDPRLRKGASETLGRIGPIAQSALPALRRLIGDEDAEVRTAASDAMLSIQNGK